MFEQMSDLMDHALLVFALAFLVLCVLAGRSEDRDPKHVGRQEFAGTWGGEWTCVDAPECRPTFCGRYQSPRAEVIGPKSNGLDDRLWASTAALPMRNADSGMRPKR
jgi:hypothetical protein